VRGSREGGAGVINDDRTIAEPAERIGARLKYPALSFFDDFTQSSAAPSVSPERLIVTRPEGADVPTATLLI
jgi:hypothetical protein